MRNMLLTIAAIALYPATGTAQRSDWNAPFPAHRVMDNLYFVGTRMLGTFLITTPDGHILINSDYETTVPVIRASVEQLGFEFEDIKIVLGSHAHDDHMQADALVKELTGAQVMAMRGDVPALREMRPGGKEHPIDRVLDDGDRVTLGGTTLTAHLMPGHTKGCTSWSLELEEGGRRHHAQIVCSFGILGKLVDNEEYPEIADDYVASFAKARALPVDVFLGSHGFFYDLENKYQQSLTRAAGEPNPFIDHAGYLRYIDQQEQAFRSALQEQRNAAATEAVPSPAAAAPSVAAPASASSAADEEPWFIQHDCTLCHQLDARTIGPSYRDIANRYTATDETIELLAGHVIEGTVGSWGDTPMTAHSGLDKVEAREMVKRILALRSAR